MDKMFCFQCEQPQDIRLVQTLELIERIYVAEQGLWSCTRKRIAEMKKRLNL